MNAENRLLTIQTRLVALRAAMKLNGIKACVVPSSDPHLSEYLPERWKAREWLSGFTGSMGNLVVTDTKAGVWADSRYWTQAEHELAGTGVMLMKINSAASTDYLTWIAGEIKASDVVCIDGSVFGLASARALSTAVHSAGGTLRTDLDLLDQVWTNRPDLPATPVYEHKTPFAPLTRGQKLQSIRAQMHAVGANYHFVSTLDDLAWLLNLRGQDVDYNPVFLAHVLIESHQATLFIDAAKISDELKAVLATDFINLGPYSNALAAVAALPAQAILLLDPKRVTYAYRTAVPESVKVIEQINPSTLAKSRKSATEAQFVREAMEQDGAALCEFFAWFESALNNERITELTIDEKITAARAKRKGFVCPSFSTIAGFNANGALPHYRALPESHAVIEGNGLLLIDSGGQYLGGTTDITRVLPINDITPAMRRDFTTVLRGMINLSMAKFPLGTLSPMLDSIARGPIWSEGIDFGHGTGHGVGYFLNVHEGPQSISRTIPEPHMAMEQGMITSNEPGIYREGQWGIRIENLVLNVPFKNAAETGDFGEFLAFETLTLCPIDTRCIERTMMRADEIAWLNDYHATVRQRLSPHVDAAAKDWLLRRTEAI